MRARLSVQGGEAGQGGPALSWQLGSVPSIPPWVKALALSLGVPLAVYYLLAAGEKQAGDGVNGTHTRDFANFLVQQEPAQHEQPVRRKKKRRSGWWSWLGWGSHSRFGGRGGARGTESGPFETFLKIEDEPGASDSEYEDEDGDHRDPVDFNTFLKGAIPSSEARGARAQPQQQQQPAPPPGPKPDQARVLVMYGTEFGFSKEIAEKLCDKLREAQRYWPVLEDMAEHPSGYDFKDEQALLIACSTQGDGVPPTEPRDFCEWLIAGKAGNLSHLRFSVCALGDKSYQHFCRCGKLLDGALASAGASSIAPRQDVNREDWSAVNAWMDAVVAGLSTAQLKPVGEEAAAALGGGSAQHAAEPKAKRWGKSRPYPGRVVAVEPLCNVASKDDKVTVRVEIDVGTASGLGNYTPGDALGIFAPNSPEAVADLLEAAGASGEEQIPVPSWHFVEGTDEDGAAGCAQGPTMPLREALHKCYDLRVPKAELFHALWAALPEVSRSQAQSGALQSTAAVKETEAKAASGDEAAQATLLAHLLAGGSSSLDAYFDYTGRHVSDVLRTFPSARIELSQLLGSLRALQPRLYSISSSPLEHEGRVQATIAEVRYEAFGKTRMGVASGHVSSHLKPGDRVRSYIHKNPDFRLPADPATPIIMVGPGTGLAPFRAFILHRLLGSPAANGSSSVAHSAAQNGHAIDAKGEHASAATPALNGTAAANGKPAANGSATANGTPAAHGSATANGTPAANGTATANGTSNGVVGANGGGGGNGQMVLFFGCRRRDQDYLYGRDLDAWAESGLITLFNAFSREQAAKVYVQDRLRSQADLVWQLINDKGAHFYVCGDASSMAGAVERELLSIFATRLSRARQEKAAAPAADANGSATSTPMSKKAKSKKKAADAAAAAAAAAAPPQADAGPSEEDQAAARAYLEKLAAQGRYQRDVWYT